MTTTSLPCMCGHHPHEHQNGAGRCTGHSVDHHYMTRYRCVCPYYTTERR